MIDLRSDTLTLPTNKMRKAMYCADVGDSSRYNINNGKGEDSSVNKLEKIAAEITGKEDALFVCSGTMGNLIALMSHCSKGELVGVEKSLHLYYHEKAGFSKDFLGLIPKYYEIDKYSLPKVESVVKLMEKEKIRLLCLENTHNFGGGICLSKEAIDELCAISHSFSVPVHIDGARIFNASVSLNISVNKLLENADSVMFCLSKGLGAPIGSLVCGSHNFILKARENLGVVGGKWRQAGIMAAAGIIAIKEGNKYLIKDHKNAKILAKMIKNNNIKLELNTVQTNIIIVDISPTGVDSEKFRINLESRGLKVLSMSKEKIRLVTYRGINKEKVIKAANIFNKFCSTL